MVRAHSEGGAVEEQAEMSVKTAAPRIAVTVLVMSAAAFGVWEAREGYTEVPVIPTIGDVPTIGAGSTRYPDGTRVRMGDLAITRRQASELARELMAQDEVLFRASLPGVALYQAEYDVYVDFVGQYGIGNWRKSSMRRELLRGEYRKACDWLLAWKRAGGYDCSTLIDGRPNKRCWGSWVRQQERHAACVAAQTGFPTTAAGGEDAAISH